MPSLKKLYSFDKITNRLENILNLSVNIEIPHHYKTSNGIYPLIKIVIGKDNPRRALISGGIHGDEPGGVETIVKFLEERR